MESMTASAQFIPIGGSPFAHLGPAPAVGYNPAAPHDEVQDAGLEIMEDYFEPPPVAMQEMVGQMVKLTQAEDLGNRLMKKAMSFARPGSAEPKAETRAWNSRVAGNGLYIPKPGLTFQTLRQLSYRIEVARGIHNSIVSQVLRFAAPTQKDDLLGWRTQSPDPDQVLSDDEKAYHAWLTKFLLHGGREFNALERRKRRRESFRTYLAKVTEDTLTMDHVAVETVPLTVMKGIDSFYVRDGGTFFLAAERDAQGLDSDGIYAYQVITTGAEPQRDFTFEELAIFQRNLSSDIEQSGYARSELECSVNTISLFLQAIAHTSEGIDANAIPKGFLTIFGQFDRRTQAAFKAAWSAQLRGVRNAWNLPILFAKNGQAAAQFTQTGQPFSEMAFARWIQLQTAIFCAIYGIDPMEIGMESWSAAGKSGLSGDDTEERLAASKSKCLGPLLANIASFNSENLLARFSDQVIQHFTGLDETDRKARRELQTRVSTINEIRASLQMPPHPLGWFGELPADPQLIEGEYKRMEATMTFNEGRKVWGGLDPVPDERLGQNPLNPSMGATWNQIVMSAAPQEEEPPVGAPGEDGGFSQYADDLPEGEGEAALEPGQDRGEAAPEGKQDQGPPAGGARRAEVGRALEGMR